MTDLGGMELFVQAAALGSLTKAAIKLDLTQPAASRQIAALETRLGGRLFHRTGRGVRLTELGAGLLPCVEGLLDDADRVVCQARALAGKPSGVVKLGVLPSISRPLVAIVYRVLRARWPAIRLQVEEAFGGLLDEAIANGAVDLAVLNRYGSDAPPGEDVLGRAAMLVIGAPNEPLTRGKTVAFRDLDGVLMLLPSAPNVWRGVLDKLARKHDIRLNEAMVVDSVSLLADVVAGGGCHAIVPGYAVRADVIQGRLRAARLVRPAVARMLTLAITSQRPMTLAVREVARAVRLEVPSLVDELARRERGDGIRSDAAGRVARR